MKEQWKKNDTDAKLLVNAEEGLAYPYKIEIPLTALPDKRRNGCCKKFLTFILVSLLIITCAFHLFAYYEPNHSCVQDDAVSIPDSSDDRLDIQTSDEDLNNLNLDRFHSRIDNSINEEIERETQNDILADKNPSTETPKLINVNKGFPTLNTPDFSDEEESATDASKIINNDEVHETVTKEPTPDRVEENGNLLEDEINPTDTSEKEQESDNSNVRKEPENEVSSSTTESSVLGVEPLVNMFVDELVEAIDNNVDPDLFSGLTDLVIGYENANDAKEPESNANVFDDPKTDELEFDHSKDEASTTENSDFIAEPLVNMFVDTLVEAIDDNVDPDLFSGLTDLVIGPVNVNNSKESNHDLGELAEAMFQNIVPYTMQEYDLENVGSPEDVDPDDIDSEEETEVKADEEYYKNLPEVSTDDLMVHVKKLVSLVGNTKEFLIWYREGKKIFTLRETISRDDLIKMMTADMLFDSDILPYNEAKYLWKHWAENNSTQNKYAKIEEMELTTENKKLGEEIRNLLNFKEELFTLYKSQDEIVTALADKFNGMLLNHDSDTIQESDSINSTTINGNKERSESTQEHNIDIEKSKNINDEHALDEVEDEEAFAENSNVSSKEGEQRNVNEFLENERNEQADIQKISNSEEQSISTTQRMSLHEFIASIDKAYLEEVKEKIKHAKTYSDDSFYEGAAFDGKLNLALLQILGSNISQEDVDVITETISRLHEIRKQKVEALHRFYELSDDMTSTPKPEDIFEETDTKNEDTEQAENDNVTTPVLDEERIITHDGNVDDPTEKLSKEKTASVEETEEYYEDDIEADPDWDPTEEI